MVGVVLVDAGAGIDSGAGLNSGVGAGLGTEFDVAVKADAGAGADADVPSSTVGVTTGLSCTVVSIVVVVAGVPALIVLTSLIAEGAGAGTFSTLR